MKKFLIFSLFLFLSILPFKVAVANFLDVVINEIAWMGTDEGANYEWIELYNNKEEKINLSGWKIENAGAGNKTLEISAGEIYPKEFFLICRKEIKNCDLIIGALSLHNEYEKNGKLVLKDNLNNIVDETPEPESKKWPAGTNQPQLKQTMERIPAGWQNSENPGGTPKSQNSIGVMIETDTGQTLTETQQSSPEPIVEQTEATPTITLPQTPSPLSTVTPISKTEYPSGVIFNEILPSPEGPDAENEWIVATIQPKDLAYL